MAGEKKIYVIGAPGFSPPDMAVLRRLRARYHAGEASIIGPHVTFMFGIDPDVWGELRPHLAAVAKASGPIDIVLRRAAVKSEAARSGSSGSARAAAKHYALLLPQEGREMLTALYRTLHGGPFMRFMSRDAAYDPHVTVGLFDQPEPAKDLTDRLTRDGVNYAGRITQLDTVLTDGSSIVHYASMPLTGK